MEILRNIYYILIEPNSRQQVSRTKRFRFENAWLRESMCKKIVEDSWEKNQLDSLHIKTARCSESLAGWGKDITGNFRRSITHNKGIIKNTKGHRDNLSLQYFREESKKLTEILTQQEIFWKQRSKQLWLKEGDQNSKNFHASTKVRKKSNQIKALTDERGRIVCWDNGLQ